MLYEKNIHINLELISLLLTFSILEMLSHLVEFRGETTLFQCADCEVPLGETDSGLPTHELVDRNSSSRSMVEELFCCIVSPFSCLPDPGRHEQKKTKL